MIRIYTDPCECWEEVPSIEEQIELREYHEILKAESRRENALILQM